MPDAWTTDGVEYSIDATARAGGVITAQRENAKTTYSRIVATLVTREEAERLFSGVLQSAEEA